MCFCRITIGFFKRYRKVQNDEQVYLYLKNMKQEKNERVEVYHQRLLKLATSFQHNTTNSFLIIVFRSGLQPYLHVATIGMERETLQEHKETTLVYGEVFLK